MFILSQVWIRHCSVYWHLEWLGLKPLITESTDSCHVVFLRRWCVGEGEEWHDSWRHPQVHPLQADAGGSSDHQWLVFCVHYTSLWVLNKLTVINCVVQKCLLWAWISERLLFLLDRCSGQIENWCCKCGFVFVKIWPLQRSSKPVLCPFLSLKLQALVYDILPPTIAITDYIRLKKKQKNCQLMGSFCWCSNGSQFVSDYSGYMRCSFYSAHIACASTKKTEVLWIKKELSFYPGQTCLGFMCVLGGYATSTVLLALKPLGGRWHHWWRAAPSVV